MNVERIIKELSEEYPGKKIIKNNEEKTTEIICEIEPGLAIAVIDKSEPHFHKKAREVYELTKGKLSVYRDNKEYKLKKGERLTIEPGEVHYALSKEAWVKVYSDPAWTPEDHILK